MGLFNGKNLRAENKMLRDLCKRKDACFKEPDSPVTGDTIVPVVIALLTLIASGVAVSVLKNKKHA